MELFNDATVQESLKVLAEGNEWVSPQSITDVACEVRCARPRVTRLLRLGAETISGVRARAQVTGAAGGTRGPGEPRVLRPPLRLRYVHALLPPGSRAGLLRPFAAPLTNVGTQPTRPAQSRRWCARPAL